PAAVPRAGLPSEARLPGPSEPAACQAPGSTLARPPCVGEHLRQVLHVLGRPRFRVFDHIPSELNNSNPRGYHLSRIEERSAVRRNVPIVELRSALLLYPPQLEPLRILCDESLSILDVTAIVLPRPDELTPFDGGELALRRRAAPLRERVPHGAPMSFVPEERCSSVGPPARP